MSKFDRLFYKQNEVHEAEVPVTCWFLHFANVWNITPTYRGAYQPDGRPARVPVYGDPVYMYLPVPAQAPWPQVTGTPVASGCLLTRYIQQALHPLVNRDPYIKNILNETLQRSVLK